MIRLILCFGLYMIVVNAISNGANEPIADNQLGLTAKDCALQYCQNKDGMALWMTLVQQCNSLHANPYLMEVSMEKSVPVCLQSENNDFVITPQIAGMICSMMSLIGLFMGYSLSERWNGKRNGNIYYQELATKDSD